MEAGAKMTIGAVVEEAATVPIPAVETYAEVAEAVVNTAVVADGTAPETGVPVVATAAPSPPAGGPESANVRRIDPGAIDPGVSAAVPGPVARGPDVAIAGDYGLVVDRNWRRRDAYRHGHLGVRGFGWHGE